MNITHKIELIDGKSVVYIYVEYPAEYEFSLDFDSFKKNVANVANKIREYALKNLGGISDNTALLILNGVVVGSLLLTQLTTNNFPQKNNTEISSTIENEAITTTEDVPLEEEKKDETQEQTEEIQELKEEETDTSATPQTKEIPNTTDTSTTTNTNKQNTTVSKNNNNTTSNTSATTNTNNSNSSTTTQTNERTIKVKLASGQIITVSLEEYVVGVVAAEMPGEFQTEALKAQAVASRTYALKKTSSGAAISASTSDQTYCTVDQLKQQWGSSFDKYYNKVKSAVNATKGKCLTYNGSYIEALFFSTSNGKTEDSVNVWGNSYPYLKSVESPWDTSVSSFSKTKTISMSEISSKLGVNLTSASQITINSKTVGNRVNSITVCGKTFTGVKIRQLLGLRSADFDISDSGNNIIFTTRGYGHGVGMSQYGANGMAKAGYSYEQILKHYYTGVSIVTK